MARVLWAAGLLFCSDVGRERTLVEVWIVIESVPYEFDSIYGVYDNEEAAEKHASYLREVGDILEDYYVDKWEVKSSFTSES